MPDVFGNPILNITVKYTVPSGWIGKGVHAYYEFPDQSAGTTFDLSGNTPLDGSHSVVGPWLPQDAGKFPSPPTLNVLPIPDLSLTIVGLPIPDDPTPIRIYLVAYDDAVDPAPVRATDPNPTPNIVYTVQPPSGTIGEEFCPNLTSFSVTAGASYDRGDGKQITPINCVFDPPTDPSIAGVWIEATWDDPLAPVERHSIPLGGLILGNFTFRVDTPQALHSIRVTARTFDISGNVNTFVPGVTPSQVIQLGSLAGTINLNNTIMSLVAGHFTKAAGVFAIRSQGIDGTLIQDLAVASQKLADAAVITQKIANGQVVTSKIANANITNALIGVAAVGTVNIQTAGVTTALIGTAQITTALIANGAIVDAHIANLSVSKLLAGDMTGISLTLNRNGITTTISNFDPGTGTGYAGFSCVNGLGDATYISPTLIECRKIWLSQVLASSASGGSATLPTNPVGFVTIMTDFGTSRKVAVYN